ncbi:MAG: hypothetical protein ACC707_02845 [Thiohalomonadales bacterium]
MHTTVPQSYHTDNPLLIFVCAYHQEALTLIEHFTLKKNTRLSRLNYYQNDRLALIETGPGKLNAASATAYIAGKYQIDKSAWLNVGIAGHPTQTIGNGLLCHKITDAHTQETFFPDMGLKGSIATQALMSVDKAETDYSQACLYDMEASGFFSSVSRFTTIEFIQSFKIVSDNKAKNIKEFNKKDTHKLLKQNIDPIEYLVKDLCREIETYRDINREPQEYADYLRDLHFTVSQQTQLKNILRRWFALTEASLLTIFPTDNFIDSKQCLRELTRHVDTFSRKNGHLTTKGQ